MAVENTDEQKTFDVFCTNCNVQTAARVVAEHSRSTLSPFLNVDDVEWTNTEYNIYVYNIAACGRCESVFLVESKFGVIQNTKCRRKNGFSIPRRVKYQWMEFPRPLHESIWMLHEPIV